MSNASIGTIGMPYADLVNDRIKGFFTEVHHSAEGVHATLARALETKRFGSRMTFRVLVDQTVSESELKELVVAEGDRCLHCEALVPVRHHEVVTHIAYYSHNSTERCNDASTTSQEEMLLCSVVDKRRSPRVHDHHTYHVQISTPDHVTLDETDIRRLADIYHETFTTYLTELNTGAVWRMVNGNVVAVVRDQSGQITAVSMAEVAEIDLLDYSALRIAEISEVATHPDYQRRGLSHLACQAVLDYLYTQNIHAMFMEARANHFGMMAVAHDRGMSPRGWLVQHCLIGSRFSEVHQQTRYGDLVVFSL